MKYEYITQSGKTIVQRTEDVMLTDMEKKVIGALLYRGGVYSNELSQYAGIPKQQISGVVSSLIKKGEIVSEDDGSGREFCDLSSKYRS